MNASDNKKIMDIAFELWLKDHPNWTSIYDERIAFSYSFHYEDGYIPPGQKYLKRAKEQYERER